MMHAGLCLKKVSICIADRRQNRAN